MSQIEQKDPKELIDETAKLIQESNSFVTLRSSDEILKFNGKIYSKDDAESVIKESTEYMIKNCVEHQRKEVVNKIKAQTYASMDEFDADDNMLTIDNGMINLETFQLEPHDYHYLTRVMLPVEYKKPEFEIRDETIFEDIEKNLKDTLFWKFLTNSFTVNGEFRKNDFETVLEIVASFFVKNHIDEKAYMFLGKGENGKSVLLDYIESMLGKENVSHIPLQGLSENRFMAAELDGKLANVFADLGSDELRYAQNIKSICTNEGIQVERKHQQPYTLYPYSKLIFSCNRFPKVFDQSQGFFRRWIIVKWERNFENDPARDEHLKQKLTDNTEEKSKVFSALLHLTKKLQSVGKFTHKKRWIDIQQEWNKNADPVADFIDNFIVDGVPGYKTKLETYKFYKEIMYEKEEKPLGIGQFAKVFAEYFEQGLERDGDQVTRVWYNIDFKRAKQSKLDDKTKTLDEEWEEAKVE